MDKAQRNVHSQPSTREKVMSNIVIIRPHTAATTDTPPPNQI